jgi:hypothetical protein
LGNAQRNETKDDTKMATGNIVGKGLYLEFIPVDTDPSEVATKVLQVLFTPEGFDEKGDYAQFAMCSRTIADYSPRKQWRVTKAGVNNKDTLVSGIPMTPVNAQEHALKMIEKFTKTMERDLFASADKSPVWKLRGKPIAVEITSFDLLEINQFSAPNPALRRIQKCRVALDFPEKLV